MPVHAAQHLSTTDYFAIHLHFAFADKWQCQVGKRHKVARSTKGSLSIDYWRDVVVEEVDEAFHCVELATRVAIAERLNLQQQHDADDVFLDAVPYSTCVALHEVDLQL